MISSHQPAPEDAIPPDCPLRPLGWDDDALQARTRARRLFQGWLTTGGVDLADIPALTEFAPLARLAHTGFNIHQPRGNSRRGLSADTPLNRGPVTPCRAANRP